MLLHCNKKSIDTAKPNKLPKLSPLIQVPKIRPGASDMLMICGDHLRKASLDSWLPKCESIKLKSRQLKQPSRKKKILSKIDIAKLSSFQTKLFYSTSFYKDHLFPKTKKLIQNPEQAESKMETISSDRLIMYRSDKYPQIKERIAFFKPTHQYVGLHPYKEDKIIPKMQGLLQSWGLCFLGQQKNKFMVSEFYLGLSLRNLVSEFGKLQQCTTRLFIKQMVEIVSNMEMKGLSHNRLNLDSIVHNCQGKIMINFFKASSKPATEQQKKGSLYYLSPQIVLDTEKLANAKNDVWGIGCITLQLLSKCSIKVHKLHPYNKIIKETKGYEQFSDLKQKLQIYVLNNIESNQQLLSRDAEEFILKCLELNPQNRPNVQQLLSLPFLS